MPRMQRNIYKRKDGRYAGNYIKGRDEKGKAIYGYVYARTYAEVKVKLEAAKAAVLAQTAETSKPPEKEISITVVKTLEKYLESVKPKYKKTSIDVYERYIRSYIKPFFGEIACDNLTQEIMQSFSNDLLSKNLSTTTIQAVVSFLKSGLKSAMLGDTLNVNLPKRANPEIEVFSVDEQKKVETTAKNYDDNIYVAIMLGLYLALMNRRNLRTEIRRY